MKFALAALVLVAALAQTEAYWGYGYGGMYGGLWGGLYGGMYGGYYGGLYGGYGYGYWGKREITPPQEVLNRTECIWTRESEVLSCHAPSGIVECHTELTWTLPIEYQMFSLGLYTEAPMPMMWRILPRKIDNTGWESGKYMSNDNTMKYASLYNSEELLEKGLRIRSEVCFQRMIDLIATSARRELVEVEGEKLYVVGDLMMAKEMPTELINEEDEEPVEESSKVAELGEELREIKTRAETEWNTVEENTRTLLEEVGNLKREMDAMMNGQSMRDRRENNMWESSNMMSREY